MRRGLRLEGYDYATAGLYFVTVCVHNRAPFFGQVQNASVVLSPPGEMALGAWRELPQRFSGVEVDDCVVVMPDHVHGIIALQGDGTAPLSEVVGAFKSLTTLRYVEGVREQDWHPFDRRMWQRGYHEHIIRNDDSLREIREYIVSNPLRWSLRRGLSDNE